MKDLNQVNIDQPKWDQSQYIGRAKHFFVTTNPLNIFATPKQLDQAKEIVTKYRSGQSLPDGKTMDDVWAAKHLYDSAFHPDTGEKMFVLGRMSAQVPCNMIINAGMMTFYKTNIGVIFWQWMNQSFNALVNYTNRSGDTEININEVGMSYLLATTGALATALTLNKQVKNAPPLIGRLVPFTAVAASNCVNIPFMRRKEITDGVPVFDANNNRIGLSKVAAREGIAQVVFSRVMMAVPPLVIPPIIMNVLEKRGVFARNPKLPGPINLALCGLLGTFATPMCCAIFSQRAAIPVSRLEKSLQEAAKKIDPKTTTAYYNKGL
ncbi:hypothetical protein LSTR_LSTR006333 [Laodelphax striatellus]|uniref:Sidoreflexin n=1 Tax=Laodelphax striatellus TaxID=195883 RepID=A0A482XDM4_LAOST|nr:hypothetical protein LSTR_LSTR006333 [Laodelphax striatellus]